MCKLIMDLIPNDWKHLLRTETSQKLPFKNFLLNNKVTRKVKDFQKLFNKEIYLFQYNSAKYNKPFKFTLWPNLYPLVLYSINLLVQLH